MKTIKLFFVLIISSIFILISSCKKDDQLEFGITQTGFIKDSVYNASTDGLLFVQVESDGLNWSTGAVIYNDETSDPTEILGEIFYFGSITLPIKKNTFWKVTTSGQVEELIIHWTPLQ